MDPPGGRAACQFVTNLVYNRYTIGFCSVTIYCTVGEGYGPSLRC